uniref:Uncharacterized protein n=1 Tax=Panagrolaimus superbus TaxID=310955 RepID=A0A914ZDV1_9BILA
MARIASFTDPLLNPILVAVRTPTIRRRLRYYIYVATNALAIIFCPWKTFRQKPHRRTASSSQRKRSTTARSPRRCSSTTGTYESASGRPESVDSEITLKLFCTGQRIRSSILRRSGHSNHHNSVI